MEDIKGRYGDLGMYKLSTCKFSTTRQMVEQILSSACSKYKDASCNQDTCAACVEYEISEDKHIRNKEIISKMYLQNPYKKTMNFNNP